MEISLEAVEGFTEEEIQEIKAIIKDYNTQEEGPIVLPLNVVDYTHIVVAKENNTVVGYVKLLEATFLLDEQGKMLRELSIAQVVVDRHHKGKGIPKMMYDYAYRHMAGYDRLRISLLPKNQRLVRFHEDCGFKKSMPYKAGPMLLNIYNKHGYDFIKPVTKDVVLTFEDAKEEIINVEKEKGYSR